MKQKQLQKKYSELIKSGNTANGRKETVSFFHKAEKVRTKILNRTKKTCPKCNGIGFKRISLEISKTCLYCCGKGFILRNYEKI
tara:strand:- start:321 stop:572 length:252 start_codon:yes stop_codon:yes gene_type:complete